MTAMASSLEGLVGGTSREAEEHVRQMRQAIEALRRMERVDLDRADRVKEVLQRGSEALRAFASSHGARWLDPWIDAAADAATAIDAQTPLRLERAAVQDALRSLGDAILVAEQFAAR